MEQIEAERKFLVKPITSWENLSELFNNLVDIKRITQTYLLPKDGEQAARIRKTKEGLAGETETVYHYNQKEPIEAGVHKETEYEISAEQYQKYLKQANPSKNTVEKTRFVFKYKGQLFELDIFKGKLKSIAILEIELNNIKDRVELPPYLEILKEVTTDKRYNNFNLSNK